MTILEDSNCFKNCNENCICRVCENLESCFSLCVRGGILGNLKMRTCVSFKDWVTKMRGNNRLL